MGNVSVVLFFVQFVFVVLFWGNGVGGGVRDLYRLHGNCTEALTQLTK